MPKRPILIGQPVTIRAKTALDGHKGTVLDVMPAGQFFETVDAILVLVEVPGCPQHGALLQAP